MKLKGWLGGLDSNQDSQIQSLESYQLDDLPTEGADRPAQAKELIGQRSSAGRTKTNRGSFPLIGTAAIQRS